MRALKIFLSDVGKTFYRVCREQFEGSQAFSSFKVNFLYVSNIDYKPGSYLPGLKFQEVDLSYINQGSLVQYYCNALTDRLLQVSYISHLASDIAEDLVSADFDTFDSS